MLLFAKDKRYNVSKEVTSTLFLQSLIKPVKPASSIKFDFEFRLTAKSTIAVTKRVRKKKPIMY